MNCPKSKYPLHLHRLLVLLVVALVSLPCPAKRELKHIMDIPVALDNHNKPNEDQLNSCSTYTAINTELQSDRLDLPVGAGLLSELTYSFVAPSCLNNKSELLQAWNITPKLPLFILHEQYRL